MASRKVPWRCWNHISIATPQTRTQYVSLKPPPPPPFVACDVSQQIWPVCVLVACRQQTCCLWIESMLIPGTAKSPGTSMGIYSRVRARSESMVCLTQTCGSKAKIVILTGESWSVVDPHIAKPQTPEIIWTPNLHYELSMSISPFSFNEGLCF